jgi:hypothetical protein
MRSFVYNPRATRQRGQSMVEFALTAMILFLMLFGILEVSRLVFTISDINNSAREGAYYAALHPETTVAGLTQSMRPKMIIVAPADVQIALDCPTCSGLSACLPPGCNTALYQPLTVTVGYTLSTGIAFPGFAGGIRIETQATARRER